MKNHGVFYYATSESSSLQPTSDNSDAIAYAPEIYYNSPNKEWIVSFSGKWLNDNWQYDGSNGNVGGTDAFGVYYRDTSGSTSVTVKRYAAYLYNDDYTLYKYTSNSSNAYPALGTIYKLQDYIDNGNYVGDRWVGSCTYDSNFANFSGTAAAFYIHTWDQTSITSITMNSTPDGPTVSYTFSVDENHFESFSSDTVF